MTTKTNWRETQQHTPEDLEVVLAEEGTPLADFQKFRTEVVSEMLDGPNQHGIFRTSRLYAKLDRYFEQALASQVAKREGEIEMLINEEIERGGWSNGQIEILQSLFNEDELTS